MLPRGRLREPLRGLSRADCIVITRTEEITEIGLIKDRIKKVAGDDVPVLTSRMVTSRFRALNHESDPATLLSQPIAAFCGVGNPASFFNHLRRAGYQLVLTKAFPDHHRYQEPELNALVGEATAVGAKSLVTTAKDATKLKDLKLDLPGNVMEIQISIDDEDRLVDLIRKAIFKPAARSN